MRVKSCSAVAIACLLGIAATAHAQITTFPYTQNFESFPVDTIPPVPLPGPSGWTNSTSDSGQDWYVNMGPTPSSPTGPNVDHTTGTASGIYLYVEDSGFGGSGQLINLLSPVLDISGLNNPRAQFWVFAHDSNGVGSTNNELHVDIEDNVAGTFTNDVVPVIRHIPEPTQTIWTRIEINLTPFVATGLIRVRFRAAMTGVVSISHDMAIDDFTVFESADPEIEVQRPVGTAIFSGGTDLIGAIAAGSPTNVVWTIENLGATQNLNITAISAAPSGVMNCTVTASPVLTPPSPIAGGATATFAVDITPSGGGAWQFTITIDSNDADESTYTITVQGFGAFAGTMLVSSDPGDSPDFSDLGAAFDALEASGLAGPLVIEIADGAGPYASAASYQLSNVAGLSAANTLTIRNRAGDAPIIEGDGPQEGLVGASGTILLQAPLDFVSIEGLEIRNGSEFGIAIYSGNTTQMSNMRIANCRIHGYGGTGIWVYSNGASHPNITIENNFIWDIEITTGLIYTNGIPQILGAGAIGFFNIGTGTVVRHNTILVTTGLGHAAITNDAAGPAAVNNDFSYNIIHVGSAPVSYFGFINGFGDGFRFNTADFNLYFGATQFELNGAVGLPTWRANRGVDASSTDGVDPTLTDTTAGSEDLHLQGGSPAINAAIGSTATSDIDGDTRPQGAASDIGADEVDLGPEIDVQRPAGTSLGAGTAPVADALGSIGTGAATLFTYTIANLGGSDLTITSVATSNTSNCTAIVSTTATSPVAGGSATTFTIDVTPTAASAFSFDITIVNDDGDEGTYTINASGTGITPAPEIGVQRPAGTPIADGGNDALGSQAFGADLAITYIIANTGTAPLTISGAQVSATANTNCTIVGIAQPSSPIAFAGTATFVVTVNITAAGAFDFDVSIENDDADENPYDFNVAGTGAAIPEVDLQIPAGTSVVNGGTWTVSGALPGTDSAVTITIANLGPAALTLSGNPTATAVTNCAVAVATNPTALTVGATSLDSFVVTVQPTAAGAFSATVTVISDDADEANYTITLAGTTTTGGGGGGTGGVVVSSCCGVAHGDEASTDANLLGLLLATFTVMIVLTMRRRLA